MRVSRPEDPETGFLFFFFFSNDSDIFLSILILTITSLAIHPGVVLFFTPLARDSLSRSPRACLRLSEKR